LKNHEKKNAPKIVDITSTIAILKILYLCIPVFGFPKISLYLHKFTMIYLLYNIILYLFVQKREKKEKKRDEKRRENKNQKKIFLKKEIKI